MQLRYYQQEAVLGIELQWERGHRSTLLVLPTGCGKTVTFAEVIRRRMAAGRTLVLAHREELIEQAASTLGRYAEIECEIEKAETYAPVNPLPGRQRNPVVASVQTLHAKRRARWPADAFATIVIDEAHHATARTYREICDHFPHAKVLGVTATPDRGDAVGLGNVFESVAYQFEIRRAIKEGFLCPIRQLTVEVAHLDLSSVRTMAGDLSEKDLIQAMQVDAVHHEIAGPLAREAGSRQTLVFMPGVELAHHFATVMRGYTERRVEALDGTTDKTVRRDILGRFRSGETQFLVNVGVLTEGFDAPETSCIAVCRPTKSRALYAQMIGRGTRTAEGKPDCLVLDFRGNAGRHKLVNALDVLAGGPLKDEVKKRAAEKAAQGIDLDSAIDQAEAEIEAARREAEEARQRKVQAKAKYRAQEIDPFDLFAVTADSRGPRATDRQLEMIASAGVKLPSTPSRAEASGLIDRILSRRKAGLCTPKQATLLVKHGGDPDLSFDRAREAIDALAANRWRADDMWRHRYGRQDAAE